MDWLRQQRGQRRHLLVCEGETDYTILKAIWDQIPWQGGKGLPIEIGYADGIDNLKPLAQVLSPSVYIEDRDFKRSVTDAQPTLVSKHRHTMWPRFEIECYLLYPDWLMNVIRLVMASPKLKIVAPPVDEAQIETQILAAASSLVMEHACRKTLQALNDTIGDPRLHFQLRGTTGIWTEAYILNEAQRIRDRASGLHSAAVLEEIVVKSLFQNNLEDYEQWSKSLESIRFHFSASAIFEQLVSTRTDYWGINLKWRNFVKEVANQAGIYTDNLYAHASTLTSDPRLGDLGALAAKILDQPVV